MNSRPAVAPVLFALAFAGVLTAAEPDDIDARLTRMPRPWTQPIHRLTFEEYDATLRFWAERHPKLATLQTRGHSADKLPVYLLKITDAEVPDADKQVCLVTALHGGPERSGSTTALKLAEWLLGGSDEAAETRRKQVVLFMPIPNPHSFFVSDRFGNALHLDPYTGVKGLDVKSLALLAPEKTPELAAVLSVIDEFQPEMHADLHGTGFQDQKPGAPMSERTMYQGQVMFEITGSAYSNYSLRPWDWRVTEAMIAAGRAAGFGSDRYEADAQRAFWGPEPTPHVDRLWGGRPLFYTAHYGYAKYHTMLAAFEVAWEESGVARMRGLFGIGNRVWDDERTAGYPVNRVRSCCGHFVTAYGRTAAERRRSRVELWSKQGAFSLGMLYPQTDGRDTFACAVTAAGVKALDGDLAALAAKLQTVPGVRAETVQKFVQAGPEARLYLEPGDAARAAAASHIENGIGFRLRLPYARPELLDLRLNGHLLAESAHDGFELWQADGFTQVQINVPPEKARSLDLFLVTCAYRPDVQRSYGFAPPPEVVRRLKQSGK